MDNPNPGVPSRVAQHLEQVDKESESPTEQVLDMEEDILDRKNPVPKNLSDEFDRAIDDAEPQLPSQHDPVAAEPVVVEKVPCRIIIPATVIILCI